MKAKKVLLFVLPAIIVIGFDRFTKHLVRTNPDFQHWIVIPGVLNFNFTLNPGMAMGIDWLSTPTVSIIAIIATIAIIIYVLYTMRRAKSSYTVFMGMIVGGAIGNIIDRLILAKIVGYGGILDGHVVDFIHFMPTIGGYQVFPYVFNVADSSITIAIICLLIFNKQIFPKNDESQQLSNNYGGSNTNTMPAESKTREQNL